MITQADLQGHWRRDWITAPGFEDHSTRVHWMQAGALYADIRVPLDRPDISDCFSLADLPDSALQQLMRSEGFAGTITVAAGRCTWQREINWQGPPEMDDIGQMFWQDGALMEDGVLADYQERWLREPCAPLRGHRLSFGQMSGVLIENDAVFLIGMGPALDRPTHKDCVQNPSGHAQFDSTYCLGRWNGHEGTATLSTNPFCEGKVVLTRGRGFAWHAPTFDGRTDARDLKAA